MQKVKRDNADLDGSVTGFDRVSRRCLTELGLPTLGLGALGVSAILWTAIVWVL